MIFASDGKGVLAEDLESFTPYWRDRIARLRKHSADLAKLIVQTGGHVGSKSVYTFSQWWLD